MLEPLIYFEYMDEIIQPNPTEEIQSPLVKKRKEVVFTANDDAYSFCDSVQVSGLPMEFKLWVVSLLKKWKLLNADVSDLSDESYHSVLLQAKEKLTNETVALDSLADYSDTYECQYSNEEKQSHSDFLALEKAINEVVIFKSYFESTTFTVVIIRKDGKRQVFKTIQPKRPFESIQNDLEKKPQIFPDFQIVKLENEKLAILVDWIEGHNPQNDEERQKCLQAAEELKSLQNEQGTGDWKSNLDLNDSNFKITSEGQVYYIDQHLILGFINYGFKESSS